MTQNLSTSFIQTQRSLEIFSLVDMLTFFQMVGRSKKDVKLVRISLKLFRMLIKLNLFSVTDYKEVLACNHARSYKYYAESVGRSLKSPAFISKQCKRYALEFDSTRCSDPSPVSMGFYADKTVYNPKNFPSINYYLETNEQSPFSKD